MKKLFALLLIICSLLGNRVLAEDFDVDSKYAIAIEATTGKILYEKNADKSTGIASVTKLLTAYLVYQEIAQRNLDWNTKVAISDYAYDLTTTYAVSNVPLEAREYTVKQLLNVMLVGNANSPAIALAEHISGSEKNFVNRMRKQLEDWGITDYQIINASGLNNEFLGDFRYPNTASNAENRLSARSVAIIAQHLVTDFPEVLEITSKPQVKFAGMKIPTINYMLEKQIYFREGVDGLMSGYSERYGQSLVVSSTENNMSIISVVLNANDSHTVDYSRFIATNQILRYVNLNYEMTTVLNKGRSFKSSHPSVIDGKKPTVPAVAKEDLKAVQLKHSPNKNNLTFTALKSEFEAPIKENQALGTATFKDPNLVGKGYLTEPPKVDMVAKTELKRSFFLKVIWNHFVRYVNDKL